MNKIGSLFLSGSHFADEANQTIGQPAGSAEVINNRRKVTSRLTPAGESILKDVRYYFEKNFNLKVYIRWSVYAGCSSCPCSPGFNILVDSNRFTLDSWERRGERRDKRMWSIYAGEDNGLDIREPKQEFPVRLPNTLVGLA